MELLLTKTRSRMRTGDAVKVFWNNGKNNLFDTGNGAADQLGVGMGKSHAATIISIHGSVDFDETEEKVSSPNAAQVCDDYTDPFSGTV